MSNQKNNNEEIVTGEITQASPVQVALSNGNFEEAVDLISSDPETFRAFITSTELAIKENKSKAVELNGKNWIRRAFTSSTSEFSRLFLEQNDVMGRFFVMLQLLTLQNKNSVSALSKLCTAIQAESETAGTEQGNLQRIAVTFLEQNIEAIKAEETRDRALIKLLKFAEQNAVFEQRITEAERRAEQKFAEATEQLAKDYDNRMTDYHNKMEDLDLKFIELNNQISAIDEYTKVVNESVLKLGAIMDVSRITIDKLYHDGKTITIILAIIGLISLALSFVALIM